MKQRPDLQMMQRLLDCNFATGELFWRHRMPDMFKPSLIKPVQLTCQQWNTKWAGTRALNAISKRGYRFGTILAKTYTAHQVIWFMCFGFWADEIDHFDGDKLNNVITNLRYASHNQNMKNTPMRRTNSSGVNGVWWCKRRSKWICEVVCNGKKSYLGQFDDLKEAQNIRIDFDLDNGFTSSHGRRPPKKHFVPHRKDHRLPDAVLQ